MENSANLVRDWTGSAYFMRFFSLPVRGKINMKISRAISLDPKNTYFGGLDKENNSYAIVHIHGPFEFGHIFSKQGPCLNRVICANLANEVPSHLSKRLIDAYFNKIESELNDLDPRSIPKRIRRIEDLEFSLKDFAFISDFVRNLSFHKKLY